MNVVDALVVTLGLDSSGFIKGQRDALAEAERSARLHDKLAGQAEAAAGRASQASIKGAREAGAAQDAFNEALSKTARNVISLYALFTGGREIKDFIAYVTQADAALGRLSASIGMAPSAVSALGQAVERSGGSAAAAAQGYQSLADALSALKTGDVSTEFLRGVGMLSNMGGKAIDLSKNREEVMRSILADINAVGKTDAALASRLGRMVGLPSDLSTYAIQTTPDQQAADAERARRYSDLMERSTKGAQELLKTYRSISQDLEMIGRSVWVDFEPAANAAAKSVLSWVEANEKWVRSGITEAMTALGTALAGIDWRPFKTLGSDFATSAKDELQLLKDFFLGNDDAMLADWKRFTADLEKYYKDVISYISGSDPDVQKAFENAFTGAIHWLIGQTNQISKFLFGRNFFDQDGNFTNNAPTAPPPAAALPADGDRQLPNAGGLGLRSHRDAPAGGGPTSHRGDQPTLRADKSSLKTGDASTGRDTPTPRGNGKGSSRAAGTDEMMAYAMDQLRREGVPEASLRGAAAQLVGQATMESSLDPNKTHDKDRYGNPTGYGIYGARLDRRDDMLAWLAKNGYARNSPEGQMRYMAHEAMTGHRGKQFGPTRGILMRGGASREDTFAVTRHFEGPLVVNDRSGAVVHAYRTGPRAMKAPPIVVVAPKSAAPVKPSVKPQRQPNSLMTYWYGIDGAAAYSHSLSRMAMASTIHHNHGPIDNSQRTASTHVGELHYHAAPGENGDVIGTLRKDLQKRGLVGQSDYGLA